MVGRCSLGSRVNFYRLLQFSLRIFLPRQVRLSATFCLYGLQGNAIILRLSVLVGKCLLIPEPGNENLTDPLSYSQSPYITHNDVTSHLCAENIGIREYILPNVLSQLRS